MADYDTTCPSLCRENQDVSALLMHQRAITLSDDIEDVRRVAVRRKHILQDTLNTLKRIPWKATKYIKVAFIGEPGVDDGGPRREFFRLLLESIGRSNMYFRGPVGRRIPSSNALALHDQIFFYIGQIFGLSLLHDGPFVRWLAPVVVNYILGVDASDGLSVEDIPDKEIGAKVEKVYAHVWLCNTMQASDMIFF